MFLLRLLNILVLCNCCLYAKKSLCYAMIDGAILEGQCKGILKDGKFVNYYDNGVLAWEVSFRDGILHGPFKHYYRNGNLHFSGYYKKGVLDSKFIKYNIDESVFTAEFKKGVLHNWIYVFINGVKVEALKYYYGKLVRKDFIE